MTLFSTAVALVFPVASITVTSPVPLNPTVKAAARPRRGSSARVFTGTSWTTRGPFCKLNNDAAPINLSAIKPIPCIICILGIAELNKAIIILQVHISHSPIFAEKELNILGPGVLRKMAHIQFCVTTVAIIPIVTVSIAVSIAIVTVVVAIVAVIIATIPIIIPSHLGPAKRAAAAVKSAAASWQEP